MQINTETFRQILLIDLNEKSKENVIKTIKQLEKIDGIVYAGPDYACGTPGAVPNDIHYSSQWALNTIDIESAWNITTGSAKVRVGVMDTGIASHVDLNGKCITGGRLNAFKAVRAATAHDTFTGDVNGDGRADMIVQWGSAGKRQLLIYTAKADGTYNAGVNESTINSYNPGLCADMYFVDDVNGDSRDDFIVKWKDNVDGRVKFLTYLGAADGTFTAAVRTEPSANIPYYS